MRGEKLPARAQLYNADWQIAVIANLCAYCVVPEDSAAQTAKAPSGNVSKTQILIPKSSYIASIKDKQDINSESVRAPVNGALPQALSKRSSTVLAAGLILYSTVYPMSTELLQKLPLFLPTDGTKRYLPGRDPVCSALPGSSRVAAKIRAPGRDWRVLRVSKHLWTEPNLVCTLTYTKTDANCVFVVENAASPAIRYFAQTVSR